VPPVVDELMSLEDRQNDGDRVKLKYSDKINHPSATLTTTNPNQNGLGLNPGLCKNRPATASAMAQNEDIHNHSVTFTQNKYMG
jgi:hypothetical protein